MVRRCPCAVSNHEANAQTFILRDAAKTPLLRMRISVASWRPSLNFIFVRAVEVPLQFQTARQISDEWPRSRGAMRPGFARTSAQRGRGECRALDAPAAARVV